DGALGQGVVGVERGEFAVEGEGGGGVGFDAVNLLDAGEEVAGVDAEFVGRRGGGDFGEDGGGAVEVGFGFGLEVDEGDGLAEAGLAVGVGLFGEEDVGVLEEAEGGHVPGIGRGGGLGGEERGGEEDNGERE